MKKRMFRRRITALVVSVLMLIPMFTFSGAAAETDTLPTTKLFRNQTYDEEFELYYISVCATYGKQSETNKRQSSLVRLESYNTNLEAVDIAWHVTARNCYIDATDMTEATGYVNIEGVETWYQTGLAEIPYDMDNLALFQRIFTYYDFGYDRTSVNLTNADVMHTVTEYIGVNFTIYGYE